MRFAVAGAVLCVGCGLAVAAEKLVMPAYFVESWQAVASRPLTSYRSEPKTPPIVGMATPASVAPMPQPAAAAAPEAAAADAIPMPPAPPAPRPVATVSADPAPADATETPAPTPPRRGQQAARTPDAPAAPATSEANVTIAVPAAVRVRSESSFIVGSSLYRLDDIKGLVDDRCTREASGRCIRHPMRALKEAIAGATLRCGRVETSGGSKTLFDCRK